MIVLIFLIFTSSFFYECTAVALKRQEEVYLPSFRSGHNVSVFLSGEYNTWSITQNASAATNQALISPILQSRFVPAVFVRYTYDINIAGSTGFFLGSTAGLLAEQGSYGNFTAGYGISFPTATIGLIQNFKNVARAFVGAEYGAVWFPQMTIQTDSGISEPLAGVPGVFSLYVGSDFFIDTNTAFTAQIGGRYSYMPCLNGCNSSTYLNTLTIQGQSEFVQLGMTWLIN